MTILNMHESVFEEVLERPSLRGVQPGMTLCSSTIPPASQESQPNIFNNSASQPGESASSTIPPTSQENQPASQSVPITYKTYNPAVRAVRAVRVVCAVRAVRAVPAARVKHGEPHVAFPGLI